MVATVSARQGPAIVEPREERETSSAAPAEETPTSEETPTAAPRRVSQRSQLDARSRHLADSSSQQVAFDLHNVFSSDSPSDAPAPEVNPEGDRFIDRALENFDEWDADSDGYLSESEVADAVNDGSNTGNDAAAAASLHHMGDELEELSDDEFGDENDGITRRDLAEFHRLTQNGGTDVTNQTEGTYADGRRRIRETSRELFVGEASTEHMRQGRNGTCDLNAAAGSIAAQDAGDASSNRLEDMITDNEDGTYTVDFPDRDPVTVDRPTDAEIARYSTAGENGLWMTVLEKAYGQVRGSSDVAGDAGSGAFPGAAIGNLTDGSDVDFLSHTRLTTTREKMTSAFADGRPVTAHIHRDAPWGDSRRDGLPMGHAYSVTGYDPATDTVTLRNPWGRTEPTDADGNPRDGVNDGTFTMTLAEFDETYTHVAYAEND